MITDYPEGRVEWIDAPDFPRDVDKEGSRSMPFSREIWVERSDYMEDPPRKFHRLSPGSEVRLRHAYVIRCDEVVKDPESGEGPGTPLFARSRHDGSESGGWAKNPRYDPLGVGAARAAGGGPSVRPAVLRAGSRGQISEEGQDFTANLNPDSLVVVNPAWVEPALADDPPGTRYQFERQGYFISDPIDSAPGPSYSTGR